MHQTSRQKAAATPALQKVTMKNFEFLFTAWMVVWAVFFVYELSVARRITQTRKKSNA